MALAGIGSNTMKNFVKVYSKLINYKYIDVVYIVLKLNPKPKTIWKKIESFYIKEKEIFCLLSKAANGWTSFLLQIIGLQLIGTPRVTLLAVKEGWGT